MTNKQFINALANGSVDVLALLVNVLEELKAPHCIIGGLAVNAYAEPVVSLDVDLVVGESFLDGFCAAAAEHGFSIEHFPNRINLKSANSDLRIQLQTDPRYQVFLARAVSRNVLGYALHVAQIEDVLAGKTWAYLDASRRPSKRQKDLADIMRLVEAEPDLGQRLPEEVKKAIPR